MYRNIQNIIAATIFLSLAGYQCRAGTIGHPLTGKEPHLFEEFTGPFGKGGGCNVIIAKVVALSKTKEGSDMANRGFRDILVLDPLASLAGSLDPSTKQRIKPGVFVSGSSLLKIQDLPPVGSVVLVVVVGNDQTVFDTCEFMPDESGLVVLKGFDDKRINETLQRLRIARAAAEAEAKRAETQPAKEEK